METFEIDYQQHPKVVAIMHEHPELSQFHFLEILHLLSLREGDNFNSDIEGFLDRHILNHP